MTVTPLLLTVEEAAQALRLSRAKCYQLIKDGEIPTVSVGRSRRVVATALEQYVASLTEGVA